MLNGERDHRGGAAERGRSGARREAVGHDRAAGRKALRSRLIEMAMGIDAAGHDEALTGLDGALAACEAIGEGDDLAAADTHVAFGAVARGHHGSAADHQVEGAHAINPSPRLAQKVIRCSMAANSAYITMPMTAITTRPANTSGVSKFEVAAIIR